MTASSAESVDVGGAAQASPMFVINLAASTSPMALSHPSSPELKRYTFFVSRHREEGRERFRLHMGYFSSQEEAESLLLVVRDIYPAAWAGPAPAAGAGRRGRSPVPVNGSTPARPATPVAPAPLPELPESTTLVPPATAAPAPLDSMSNVRDVLAELSEEGPVPAPAPAAPAKSLVALPAAVELSSAAALSLLEEPAAPGAKSVSPPPRAVEAKPVEAKPIEAKPIEAKPIEAKPVEARPVEARRVEARPAEARPVEARPLEPAAAPPLKNPFEGLEKEPEVRLVTPEDTQTLTDIKLDRQNNAPPCFAVQLVWSVTPIDADAMPHLAIFDAYTLYNVEGNRQGRKWYGLRLGFFSDPNSASQVANYVRSDYKNVAVVPVAVKERDRARGGAPQPGAPAAPAQSAPRKTSDTDFKREAMEGFELLADDRPVLARRDIGAGPPSKDAAAAARAATLLAQARPAAQAPARPAVAVPVTPPSTSPAAKPTGKRAVARRRPPSLPAGRTVSAGVGGPDVLESTLDILGASTLSLDVGGNELITDAAARKPDAKKSSAGVRFSKLLSKLGGS